MLNQLRNLALDRMDMAEMVALAAFGRSMAEEYEVRAMEAPEWLTESLEALGGEIAARRKDELRRQLKQVDYEIDRIKPAAEKRKELAARAERLRTAIGD